MVGNLNENSVGDLTSELVTNFSQAANDYALAIMNADENDIDMNSVGGGVTDSSQVDQLCLTKKYLFENKKSFADIL